MNVLFFLFFFQCCFPFKYADLPFPHFAPFVPWEQKHRNVPSIPSFPPFFPGGETETNSNSKLSSVEVSPSSGLPVKNLGFLRYKLGDWVHPHDMPYNQRLQKIRGIQPPDFRITSQTMVKRIGI